MDILRYFSDFFATFLEVPHLLGAAVIFMLWCGFWLLIDLKGKWGEFEKPENRTQR